MLMLLKMAAVVVGFYASYRLGEWPFSRGVSIGGKR